MELSLANRKAITRSQAVRYRNASKAGKAAILDSVCAVTGFNRDYARRALRNALRPRIVVTRALREPRVWRDCCWRAGEVLGGAERAGGQAAGADAGRAGSGAAPVRRAGHR